MKVISVRKAEVKDALLLSNVALKAYADHYLHLWHDGGKWYMKKSFSVEKISDDLANPDAVFYHAFYNNSPAGFMKLNVHAPFRDHKNALELERIYNTKDSQFQGIGKELVQLTFTMAKENNKDLVWLKAMDTSAELIAFYKKMGFEIESSCRLDHALMKEELRGMVIMKRRMVIINSD